MPTVSRGCRRQIVLSTLVLMGCAASFCLGLCAWRLRPVQVAQGTAASAVYWVMEFVSAKPDLAILDLNTGKMSRSRRTRYPKHVVSVDLSARTFRTMVRDMSGITILTQDATFKEIGRIVLPGDLLGGEGYYGVGKGPVFSPDGNRLAYMNGETDSLCWFDIPKMRETIVWEKIAESSLEFPYLEWLSDSTLILCLQTYTGSTRTTNEITIVDVTSGARRIIYNPVAPADWQQAYSISPDRSLLAFEDANKPLDIYGVIKVLDLSSGELRAVVGDGNDLIGDIEWTPDGAFLLYRVTKHNTDTDTVNLWALADGKERVLRGFPEMYNVHRIVPQHNRLACLGEVGMTGNVSMSVISLETGADIYTIKASFGQDLFSLDDEGLVLCEMR